MNRSTPAVLCIVHNIKYVFSLLKASTKLTQAAEIYLDVGQLVDCSMGIDWPSLITTTESSESETTSEPSQSDRTMISSKSELCLYLNSV